MLLLKMLKDLQQNITQFLAIFVMSCISLIVVAGTGVSDYKCVNDYMTETTFKDLDLTGIQFTRNDINNISEMEEINSVDGYYNTNGKIELSEDVKVLISYITGNNISRLFITEGEPFAPGDAGVWVDKQIADAKGIKVGDTLNIISEDVRFSQEVKGLCYSTQYMYYAVDSTFVEPDYTKYGFLFMDIDQYHGEDVSFDELLVDVKGVKGELDLSKEDKRLINRAGKKIKAYFDNEALVINEKSQDFQLKAYVEAVDTNKMLQILFPIIFGSIALLGILTTMTRLISRQRTTIGALKALGFTSGKIILHYMSYSFFIVLLGCVIGAVIGYFALGPVMNQTMTHYYLNPFERMELSGAIYVFTAVLLGGAALVSYCSNAKLLKLSAAGILQPQAPASSGKSWYEVLSFWKKLKFATQWNVRDISGNPFRTFMSIMGVIVCSGLIFSSFGFLECLNNQGSWLYENLIKAKNKIELSDMADYGTAYDYAMEYKGQLIQRSSIRLRAAFGEKNTAMYVVDDGNNYFLQDKDGNYTELPLRGVAMTQKLMDMTGVKTGDRISWNIAGEKDIYEAVVVKMVRTPLDQGIYITRDVYEDLRGSFEPGIIYTSLEVPGDIEDRPDITSVNTIADLKAGMDSGNADYTFIVGILVFLAILLGSVILYNLGSMSYNEKLKDMATLKVLGFSSRDLKVILMQQNLIITGVGAVGGILLGFPILDLLTSIFGEEVDCLISLSLMPYVVDMAFTFILSVIVNQLIVSRLENINMVEALKGV